MQQRLNELRCYFGTILILGRDDVLRSIYIWTTASIDTLPHAHSTIMVTDR
jgi:hypothetical protein